MQWQTILGFAFVILGLVFIVLGLHASFAKDMTRIMSIRAWRIYFCLFGLGFALLGWASICQQRPPLFGMSVATALGIGFITNIAGSLSCFAGIFAWLTRDPNMKATMRIPPRVREWIYGNSPLPEAPNQPPTHD